MKITTMSILIMFLASALVLPVGMSYAQNANMSGMAGMNQTGMMYGHGNYTGMHGNYTGMHGNYTGMHGNYTGMHGMGGNYTGMMHHHGMNQTGAMPMMTPTVTPTAKMQTPLQQVKAGVAPKDVQCTAGTSLIMKAEDGSAACVDSSTATILITRGWATHS
ncbi:MAG: hypothetical protein WBV92_08495 [Nitrosotalea sp.]